MCPKCGAWSSVLSTRENARRRECANGHRFSTIEVPPSVVNKKDYQAFRRGMDMRARNRVRDARIVADARSASAVARQHGLTEARVRQIRAAARQEAAC